MNLIIYFVPVNEGVLLPLPDSLSMGSSTTGSFSFLHHQHSSFFNYCSAGEYILLYRYSNFALINYFPSPLPFFLSPYLKSPLIVSLMGNIDSAKQKVE